MRLLGLLPLPLFGGGEPQPVPHLQLLLLRGGGGRRARPLPRVLVLLHRREGRGRGGGVARQQRVTERAGAVDYEAPVPRRSSVTSQKKERLLLSYSVS